MYYIQVSITIVIAVLGWVVGYYINTKRDQINRKKEIVIKHLIEVYRLLSEEIANRVFTSENKRLLENILTEIQLFGNLEQISLAKKLSKECEENGIFSIDNLVKDIKNELRKELGLEQNSENIIWLRFEK